MIANHLKIAWRNLMRNRGFTIINVLGLTIGLVCFMLILLYIQDEMSYDKWQANGDRIYRVALERKYPGRSRFYAIIPPSYANSIQQDFSEVETSCRLFFFQGNSFMIKKGQDLVEEPHIMWADSNFFDLFSIAFLKGDKNAALVKPNSVVLTETTAKKYFGDADPIGKILDLAQTEEDLLVTGVCGDVPENSHFKFDLLMSSTALGFIQQPNFINFSAYTYLRLTPGGDPAALEKKLPEHVIKYASGQILNQFGVNYEEYQKQGNGYRYFLQPLGGIYLDSNLESEMKPPGSRERIYFFTVIAALILIIACINFMNLATARSANRAREVGIRKTLGSDRRQIAGQFFMEAVLITLISAILAAGINFLVLPAFNEITGKALATSTLFSWRFVLILTGAAALTGVLSGVYPAFALSAFKPIEVLRGKFLQTKKGSLLRNLLVVFQFGISVFLIISTILVYRQMAFTQNKSLGFDKESVVTLQGAGGMTPQQEETFKKEIGRLPGVAAVSGCNTQPGGQYFGLSFKPQSADETTTGSGLIVDEGYIECMKMEMSAGRSFSEDFMDTLSIVINEAAAREMELKDPVGATLVTNDGFLNPVPGQQSVYTIIGVVRDFHFQSLHQVISPLFLLHNQRSFQPGVDNLITIRMRPANFQGTLQQIETMWKNFQPETPFRYAFLDQEWAALYEKEMTTRRVFGIFSFLAIIIACLGLLALAAFTAERRTKEIGIRKVLGATTGGIIGLLSKDFLKLVVVAIVIASPVAWYAMDKWLQDFAYRIDIEWWVFLLAGVLAVAIAFLTVSAQSVKAALANPVESLKSD